MHRWMFAENSLIKEYRTSLVSWTCAQIVGGVLYLGHALSQQPLLLCNLIQHSKYDATFC